MPSEELEILSDIRVLMETYVDAQCEFLEDDDDGILVVNYKGINFAIIVSRLEKP